MYAEQATARRALPRLPPNSLRAHLPSDELPEEDEARSERSIPRQHPQYQSSYSEQILPYSSAARSTEPSDNATYVDEQQLSPSAEQPEPPEEPEPEVLDDVHVPSPPAQRNANAALPHQESNASARSEDVTGTEADDERDSLHEHKPLAASRSQPPQETQPQPQQQQQLTRSHSGQVGGGSGGEGVECEYEEFGREDEQDEQWLADGDEQPEEYEEGSSAHGVGDDIRRRRGNNQTQYRREMFRSFRDKHPSSSRSQQQPQPQRPEQPPSYDRSHPRPHASRSLCDDAGVNQFEPEPEPEPEAESLNMEATRAADGEEALGSLGDREQFTPEPEPEPSPQPPYENEEQLPHMDASTPTAEPDTLHERERQADGADSYERIEYANVDGAEEQTEEVEVEARAGREWDARAADGERSPAPLEDLEEAEFERDELEPLPEQPADANKARLDEAEAEDEFPDDEQEEAGGGAAARWLAAFTKVCENLEVRA